MAAIPGNLLAYNVESIETDATGWTGAVNCTPTRQTTQHADGTASLRLVSTAAGAMSVHTTTAATIPASTTYVSFGGAVFTANLLASQVTLTWLNASGATITTTTVTLTPTSSTAFTYLHSGITVPAGAATVTMTIQCTATAASQTVYWDRMWIVPQYVWPGQILPLDAEFNDVATAQWTAVVNCTVGVGPVGTYYPAWGTALLLTSTAAGDMRAAPIGAGSAVPVTVGTEYMATAWMVQVSGASRTALIEIEWLAADGVTYLSSTLNSGTPVPTSTWTRVTAIGTCPAGAGTARVRLRPQAGAAAEVWAADQVGLMPTVAGGYQQPGNLLPYNTASMEMDASGWTAVSGCTIAQSSTAAYEGTYSLAITCTGGTDAVVQLAIPVPVTPGQAYQAAPTLKWAGSPNIHSVRLDWLDAASNIVRSLTLDWDDSTLPVGDWGVGSTADLCPASATHLRVSIIIRAPTAGTVWYLDHVLVGPGGLAAIASELLGEYAAQISIQGLTTLGATQYSLYRMTADGTLTAVRGPDGDMLGLTISGALAVADDYEAPLGVPVQWYVATSGAPGGGTESYTTAALTLPPPDRNYLVIKDPLLPARNCTAMVQAPVDWSRPATQGVYQPRGSEYPIVRYGVRQSRRGTLALWTWDAAGEQQLTWCVASGDTLLVQAAPGMGWDDVYVQVGDVDEPRPVPFAPAEVRGWSLPLIEVARPVGGVTGSAGRTWQDVLSGFGTWFAVYQAYTTWAGVLTGTEES